MALDNAQFISELSITDPPGTDPLSEGDDQIRTSKRAVFQSFPFVDAQVNLTAAQLNDAALKGAVQTISGVWTFTAINTFSANQTFLTDIFARGIFADQGSAAGPSYSFQQDAAAGMYLSSIGVIGFGTINTERVTIDAEGIHLKSFNNTITKNTPTDIAGFTYVDGSGFPRWLLAQSTAANTERFTLQRRDAAGIVIDSPWEVLSTDGHVQMLNANMIRNPDTVPTSIAWKTAGTVTRWSLGFEATGGFNPNSLTFTAFNSSGVFQNNPFRLGVNGTLFMEALPVVNPGVAGQLWRNPVSPGFVAIV